MCDEEIDKSVNLINISYSTMKLLLYQDKSFFKYSMKCIGLPFFCQPENLAADILCQFCQNIETGIKSIWGMKVIKRLLS